MQVDTKLDNTPQHEGAEKTDTAGHPVRLASRWLPRRNRFGCH